MRGSAVLPDGSVRPLIQINAWSFHWQDAYRYVNPLVLPAGTTLHMEYAYDNSLENPRNPHRPLKRVRYGQRSSDEMGDLWIQMVPRNPSDLPDLARRFRVHERAENIVGYQHLIADDDGNPALHDDLAMLYAEAGDRQRSAEHFAHTLRLRPESARAHYNFGMARLMVEDHESAGDRFDEALRLDPAYAHAHYGAALVRQARGQFADAERHFRRAFALAPDYLEALNGVGTSLFAQGKHEEAEAAYREALERNPEYAEAVYNLALALSAGRRYEEAADAWRRAIELRPDWTAARVELARLLADGR